ncbi:uncharacterized protein [Haliotis asinina]|uniref:uncharacterized protein isoform X2 n=1 Tax=Haliotis asinina TaxID=109174 RepID=UPI0035320034
MKSAQTALFSDTPAMQALLLFLAFVTLANCHDCVLQPFKIATRGRTYQIPATKLSEGVHPANKCGLVVVCSSSRVHVCRHINDKSCSEIVKNCSILTQAFKNGPFRCVTKLPRARLPSDSNFVGDLRRRKRSLETTTSTEAFRNDFQTTQPPTTTTTAITPPTTKQATKRRRRSLRRQSTSTSTKPEKTEELVTAGPTSASHPKSFGMKATDSWCVEEVETTEANKTSSSSVTIVTMSTTEEVPQTSTTTHEAPTTTTEGWKLVHEGTTNIPVTTTTALPPPFRHMKGTSPHRSP